MSTCTDSTIKVLVIAHGHPDHSKGGGEIAAYNLHQQLSESSGFDSVFFARHNRRELIHGGTPSAGTGREKEIIMYATMPDWFRFSQPDKALVWRDFRQALEVCKPDIVHFHHYLHLGLEFLREVKNFDPNIRIVMTLHEYYAICHNQGQMVKTDRSLCHYSSPDSCAQCFRQYSAQDFMLRKLFINSHFDLVDEFIAPSQFLKSRYTEWGLAENRIRTIENLLNESVNNQKTQKALNTIKEGKRRVRFAFFGQINWFKGVDLLLQAVALLPATIRQMIQLDINGSGLEHQPKALREEINQRLQSLDNCVNFRGAYTQQELPQLMCEADWMVVPSKWWENSPVVILEARKHGLPVLCSNIGGMAEKINHGKTGMHFQARRPDALARTLIWATDNVEKQAQFSAAIRDTYAPDDALQQHLNVYRQLTADNRKASPFVQRSSRKAA